MLCVIRAPVCESPFIAQRLALPPAISPSMCSGLRTRCPALYNKMVQEAGQGVPCSTLDGVRLLRIVCWSGLWCLLGDVADARTSILSPSALYRITTSCCCFIRAKARNSIPEAIDLQRARPASNTLHLSFLHSRPTLRGFSVRRPLTQGHNSLMVRPRFLQRHSNVYVYIPNLIGYLRIAAALIAFAVATSHPVQTVCFYFVGFVCDELDGRFARMFSQTSTLGAVLDMVTDRLSTAGLLVILCVLFPSHYPVFLSLLMLDILSHWFQMYVSLVAGSVTHKDINSRNWLIRCYYKHRIFMGFCCVSCEVLYLAVYLLHWERFRISPSTGLSLPHSQLLRLDAKVQDGPLSLAALVALAALPGTAVKQWVNCVQLQTAMHSLVLYDRQLEAAVVQPGKQQQGGPEYGTNKCHKS